MRFSKAVWARCRRGDRTAVSLLIKKIEEDPRYWWQAGRYLWTEELTEALGKSIGKIARANTSEREGLGDWIVPELVLKLDEITGESLLLPVWAEIRHIPAFLQVALYLATPKLLELAKLAVAEAVEPGALFNHLSFTMGLRTTGRAGITRLLQLQVLQPYFQLLSDLDLVSLRDVCIKRGWLDYSREYLEPILRSRDSDLARGVLGHTAIDLADLESDLKESRWWRCHHWFEQQMNKGARRDELIDALFVWLGERKSPPTLKIVGRVLSEEGTRHEFARLQDAVSDMSGIDEILSEIQFNIFHRTLN